MAPEDGPLRPQQPAARVVREAPSRSDPTPGGTMHWIAWRMLTGSRTKYLVMLFGMTFSSLLVAQQCSIFCGVLRMTAGQILDVRDADVWVIDPEARYIEDLPAAGRGPPARGPQRERSRLGRRLAPRRHPRQPGRRPLPAGHPPGPRRRHPGRCAAVAAVRPGRRTCTAPTPSWSMRSAASCSGRGRACRWAAR